MVWSTLLPPVGSSLILPVPGIGGVGFDSAGKIPESFGREEFKRSIGFGDLRIADWVPRTTEVGLDILLPGVGKGLGFATGSAGSNPGPLPGEWRLNENLRPPSNLVIMVVMGLLALIGIKILLD